MYNSQTSLFFDRKQRSIFSEGGIFLQRFRAFYRYFYFPGGSIQRFVVYLVSLADKVHMQNFLEVLTAARRKQVLTIVKNQIFLDPVNADS